MTNDCPVRDATCNNCTTSEVHCAIEQAVAKPSPTTASPPAKITSKPTLEVIMIAFQFKMS